MDFDPDVVSDDEENLAFDPDLDGDDSLLDELFVEELIPPPQPLPEPSARGLPNRRVRIVVCQPAPLLRLPRDPEVLVVYVQSTTVHTSTDRTGLLRTQSTILVLRQDSILSSGNLATAKRKRRTRTRTALRGA